MSGVANGKLECTDPTYMENVHKIILGYASSGQLSWMTINEIKNLKQQGGATFLNGIKPLLEESGVDPLPPCTLPINIENNLDNSVDGSPVVDHHGDKTQLRSKEVRDVRLFIPYRILKLSFPKFFLLQFVKLIL